MIGQHQIQTQLSRATACVSDADLRRRGRKRVTGPAKKAIETGRTRALIAGVVFALGFVAVAGRLVDLALYRQGSEPKLAEALARSHAFLAPARERADIVDRNGVVLATTLTTASLYADPKQIIDADAAAQKLARILPELDIDETAERLKADRRFVWLQRNLTPRQQVSVNRLGIPGIHFQRDQRRVYPHGRLASHVLGFAGVDNHGLAGAERFFDSQLQRAEGAGTDLQLSLDIRAQHILYEELSAAVKEQKALGGSGLIMDVENGEVLAMVSLPDFDPNRANRASALGLFNRNTLGVYEMGSTFKIFTTAMALEFGAADLDDIYDVARPIRVARHTISDLHSSGRPLSVSDIFIKSSNIGAVHLAMAVGGAAQREFLTRLGMFAKPALELPEIGFPLQPRRWREINTMTVAFGHGVAVSPVQLATAVGAVANGGTLYQPTVLKRRDDEPVSAQRVLSGTTSEKMRGLMRQVVTKGTGRRAAVPGYEIGGKTGTAEKSGRRGYNRRKLLSSFVGVFPVANPRYVVLVLIDEPKGVGGNSRRATGGWVAAPVVGQVVRRAGLMLGVSPQEPPEEIAPEAVQPIIKVSAGGRVFAPE